MASITIIVLLGCIGVLFYLATRQYSIVARQQRQQNCSWQQAWNEQRDQNAMEFNAVLVKIHSGSDKSQT